MKVSGRNLLSFGIFITLILIGSHTATAEHKWDVVRDHQKTVGPEACIECHTDTGAIWENMHHFKTFRAMPRSDEAQAIAEKMGIERIKRDSLCLGCHFTTMETEVGKTKPIAGISCESCHGAGKDWINIHSDYGSKTATRETETPAHRADRIAKSEAAGMIRPERLYQWASNCYGCHTVPEEKLVNMGGHPAGSKFELVSWSQGEVLHKVWTSGGENVPATAEQKRMMYVTGQALDLAYALRGVAMATEEATYAVTMAKRAKAATLRLKKVDALVSIPEIKEILKIADKANLDLNNQGPLTKAANQVAAATKKFSENHDGSKLSAIDSLIPSMEKYRGTPAA